MPVFSTGATEESAIAQTEDQITLETEMTNQSIESTVESEEIEGSTGQILTPRTNAVDVAVRRLNRIALIYLFCFVNKISSIASINFPNDCDTKFNCEHFVFQAK